MKKTYWWRIAILLFGVLLFSYGWVASFGSELGLCYVENEKEKCLISYRSYVDSLGYISISLIFSSIALFFVNDIIFKKWLKFAIVWFALTSIFIILSPEYSNDITGLSPTKESVSIWMSSLFVIISFIQLVVLSKKQKKG